MLLRATDLRVYFYTQAALNQFTASSLPNTYINCLILTRVLISPLKDRVFLSH
jgi:hypothetical protein